MKINGINNSFYGVIKVQVRDGELFASIQTTW